MHYATSLSVSLYHSLFLPFSFLFSLILSFSLPSISIYKYMIIFPSTIFCPYYVCGPAR